MYERGVRRILGQGLSALGLAPRKELAERTALRACNAIRLPMGRRRRNLRAVMREGMEDRASRARPLTGEDDRSPRLRAVGVSATEGQSPLSRHHDRS